MPKSYPAVVFMATHGRRIALAIGILLGLTALACALLGGGWVGVVAGLGGAVVAWAVVRLGAELVEVVAETLLPR